MYQPPQEQPRVYQPQYPQQPYMQPQPGYPPMPAPGQSSPGYPPQPQPGYPPQQPMTPPPSGYLPPQQPMMQPQPGYQQQMMYPQQQMMMQQPMMQPQAQMFTNVNVNVQKSGPGFFMRALYFLFIGWWLGYFWLCIGFGLCSLIITLPLGLMMLNRIPQVMTLKQSGTSTSVNVNTVSVQQTGGPSVMVQNVNVNVGGTQQQSMLIRAIYFIFVGWWAGYLWANLAYACCLTLILLPVGVMMFDRLPLVLTLRRN